MDVIKVQDVDRLKKGDILINSIDYQFTITDISLRRLSNCSPWETIITLETQDGGSFQVFPEAIKDSMEIIQTPKA